MAPRVWAILPLPKACREPTKCSKGASGYRWPRRIWEPNAKRIRIQNKSILEILQDQEEAFGQLLSLLFRGKWRCRRGLSPRGGRLLTSSSEDISIYGPLTHHTVFRLRCQRPDVARQDLTITPAELASGIFTNTQPRRLASRSSLPLRGSCPDFSSPASHPAPPLSHFAHTVYYFLYFVEKFLEPRHPGDLYGANKFRRGLHARPAAAAGFGIPCRQLRLPVTCRWTLWRAPVRPLRIPAMNLSHSSYPRRICGFGSTEESWNGVCTRPWAKALFFFFFFLLSVWGFISFAKSLAHKQSQT